MHNVRTLDIILTLTPFQITVQFSVLILRLWDSSLLFLSLFLLEGKLSFEDIRRTKLLHICLKSCPSSSLGVTLSFCPVSFPFSWRNFLYDFLQNSLLIEKKFLGFCLSEMCFVFSFEEYFGKTELNSRVIGFSFNVLQILLQWPWLARVLRRCQWSFLLLFLCMSYFLNHL